MACNFVGGPAYRVVEREDWLNSPYDGLVAAIRARNTDMVGWLLASGTVDDAEPKTHPLPANPPLVEAILAGRRAVIELLLQDDAAQRLAATDVACGATALHWAAVMGDETAIGLLLAEGGDIEARTWSGCSPAHCSAMHGHAAVLRALLAAGASLDAVTSPADPGEARCMRQNCACALMQPGIPSATPLHLATAYGHWAAVSVLLEHGAEVAAVDGAGRSALMHAAIGDRHSIMLLLLQSDCAGLSNTDTEYGRTCLHWACHHGHLDVANLLLFASMADIDATDARRDTALHLAARRGHTEVLEALLSRGASTEMRNVRGLTALHLAAFFGHAAAVEVLLDRANIAARCGESRTPLFWAAYNGHDEATRALLVAGAGISFSAAEAATIAADGGVDVSRMIQELLSANRR